MVSSNFKILHQIGSLFPNFSDSYSCRLPLYGEIKIAFLIYLWYPKSQVLQSKKISWTFSFIHSQNQSSSLGFWQGISYVYEKLLCPYMSRHELDIDQRISVLKIRGHFVIVQLLQSGYHWTLQIFRHLQQRFAIDKV